MKFARRRTGVAVPARVAAGLAALVLSGAAVAGCTGTGATAETAARPTPSAGTVLDGPLDAAILDLPLTDQDGHQLTLRSLAGRTIVLTDGLTTCEEVCPMTTANLRQAAQDAIGAGVGDSVVYLEITVDPERDVPERLTAYQKLYGALPNWKLVTAGSGTAALWKALGVSYQKAPVENPPPSDWLTGQPLTYDVTHQDAVFVIDAHGHERWATEGTPDARGKKLPDTVNRFLNDEGRQNLANPPQPGWTTQDIDAAVSYVTGRHVG